jgi:hypothetical protein
MRAGTAFRRLLVLSLCLVGAAWWAARAGEATAVVLPENAPEPVRWAAGELAAALRARQPAGGVPAGAIRVCLEPPPPDAAATPEAFTLRAGADEPVTVTASDATGAMYGLLEAAEQLEAVPGASSWAELRARLSPVAVRPAVRVRAVNLFLHVTPEGRLADWFHDEEFWRRLLELLARSRFNLIDLHGAYCPKTTVFSNLLPLFTGGDGPDSAPAKNLDMLRRVVAQAAGRSLRVALLNYDNREGGHRRDDSSSPSATRVAEILRGCPGLGLLGFRVKRTGANAVDSFEESYLKPCRAAGFHGSLYTRSWGTDRSTVARLARDWSDGFLVEVKYNGEQLGTPYPALHGWGEDYSFQDYLLHPRSFEILWQIRANGTLRVFPWGDPAFVRRAAASFSLGGAAGFTIEPHWAYFSVDPKDRYRDPRAALAEDERYLFERDWAFYALWGRLTYDPATPDAVFARTFVARHGPAAGLAAFRTLTRMSRIVPAVYAAYAMGVDHRDAAPEMELGLLTKNRDHWRGLDELCAIQPLDRARACSPAEFAAAAAEGRPEPRISPVEAAAELDRFAAETDAAAVELMGAAGSGDSMDVHAVPGRPAAARVLASEARALACLGASTAARLRALTAYAFYRRTNDARWLPPRPGGTRPRRRALAGTGRDRRPALPARAVSPARRGGLHLGERGEPLRAAPRGTGPSHRGRPQGEPLARRPAETGRRFRARAGRLPRAGRGL